MITIQFNSAQWLRLQRYRALARRREQRRQREEVQRQRRRLYAVSPTLTAILNEHTRRQIHQEGFFRRILPPIRIDNIPPPTEAQADRA
jgi:hypothetical protein